MIPFAIPGSSLTCKNKELTDIRDRGTRTRATKMSYAATTATASGISYSWPSKRLHELQHHGRDLLQFSNLFLPQAALDESLPAGDEHYQVLPCVVCVCVVLLCPLNLKRLSKVREVQSLIICKLWSMARSSQHSPAWLLTTTPTGHTRAAPQHCVAFLGNS